MCVYVCVFVCRSVALGIQYATRVRRIILPSVDCLALLYVPHYLINVAWFRWKFIEHEIVFWFSLQLLSQTLFILKKKNQRVYLINVQMSSCKSPLFFSDFNKRWMNFLERFPKKIFKYQVSLKNRPVGAELFLAVTQTGVQPDRQIDESNSRVSQFYECSQQSTNSAYQFAQKRSVYHFFCSSPSKN